MAVSLLRSLPWTNETLAMESFDGLKMNRYWNGWIKTNNNPERTPISTAFSAGYLAFTLFSKLFKTFCKWEKRLSSTAPEYFGQDYVPNPLGPYFYGALFLVALSAHKIMTEYEWNKLPELEDDLGGALDRSKTPEPYIPSRLDNVVEVAWQVTPYLMIITNVALTALEIHNGDNKAWIKLIATVVTLIDISSWKPEGFNWYLTVFARYPIDAAAIYYSDNSKRFTILLRWIGTEPVIPYVVKASRVVKEYTLQYLKTTREQLNELGDLSQNEIYLLGHLAYLEAILDKNRITTIQLDPPDDRPQAVSHLGQGIRVIQGKDGKVILQRIPAYDQSQPGRVNPSQLP